MHDTLEYLSLTGQITEKGRKGFYITLATKCKAKKYLDEHAFTVEEFKTLAVDGIFYEGDTKIKCNIRRVCQAQLKSGEAFDLYTNTMAKNRKNKDSAVVEEDDED